MALIHTTLDKKKRFVLCVYDKSPYRKNCNYEGKMQSSADFTPFPHLSTAEFFRTRSRK